jgi:hypothetical protein
LKRRRFDDATQRLAVSPARLERRFRHADPSPVLPSRLRMCSG